MLEENFAKKTVALASVDAQGNATKWKPTGLASIGAGIGAITEVARLRDKINKEWNRKCHEADMRGLPHPPKPDTSTKTIMALLKGSIKGAVGGTLVGMLPVVGKGLKDTTASLSGGLNKLTTNSVTGGKQIMTFSYLNTFMPTEDFSDKHYYTLEYLTDQDFADVNLNNLDVGDITINDFLKVFCQMADMGRRNFTKEELNQYFSRKPSEPIKLKSGAERELSEAEDKMRGISNVAMPVLGALSVGAIKGISGRKRALEQWKQECAIADMQGRPRPPKPSILHAAGDVAKGAAVGAVGGWVGSKIAPGLNAKLSEIGHKYGMGSMKAQKKLANDMEKNAQLHTGKLSVGNFLKTLFPGGKKYLKPTTVEIDQQPRQYNRKNNNKKKSKFFSYSDYRAALARKGQTTTLSAEEFYSIPAEHMDVLISNMQPMNFALPVNALAAAKPLASVSAGLGHMPTGLVPGMLSKTSAGLPALTKGAGAKGLGLSIGGNALTNAGLGAYAGYMGFKYATMPFAIKKAIENGSYDEYKKACKKHGVEPVSKVDFVMYGKKLLEKDALDESKIAKDHSVLGGLKHAGLAAKALATAPVVIGHESLKGLTQGIKKGVIGTGLQTRNGKKSNSPSWTYEDYLKYCKTKHISPVPEHVWAEYN